MYNNLPDTRKTPGAAAATRNKKRTNRIVFASFVLIIIASMVFLSSYMKARNDRTVESSATITIAALENHSELEVLTIRASEVIVDNASDNSQRIDAWTECTGFGIFTLDIARSEFLIDQARRKVIVRTPDVVLSDNFTLDYGETRELFFNNNWTDDSYSAGADLAESQLKRAYTSILDTIANNPYYYETARASATRIITSLIRGFNKDVENLEVVVEIGAL